MTVTLQENPNVQGYEAQALVRHRDLSTLNKTTIRLRISLKNATKTAAPKWKQVLSAEQKSGNSQGREESDLEKITKSEVGLRGISVFKALDEAASELRQEIAEVQDWMIPDNGEHICSIDLAPLVWARMLEIRDQKAPLLRTKLRQEHAKGLEEFTFKVDEFLSARTWNITEERIENARTELINRFPDIEAIDECLQVVIARPVIVPALHEQLDEQQAECLNQVTRFIENYDQNLEQSLTRSAIIGGQELAAQLLEDLANWEPGKKPVQFRKKMDKHLKKIQMLMAFAQGETSPTLSGMMEQLESIIQTADTNGQKLSDTRKSQIQEHMDAIRARLLGEQLHLFEIAEEEGCVRSQWIVFQQPAETDQLEEQE
ncbi:MAG TPA: hypothetical protein DCP31_37765 [Cyanobacteria bacterium UBA8543]|nr:hypothetical protein [Cyanobacteria bacterium UBA8543]